MAEIKKYLDTVALGTLVEQIKAEDAKGLKSAKDYADSLAKNYDASGSAASALTNAKEYTDELANGQVKLNKEAIEKLNGGVDVEGSVAKAVADAKSDLQSKIDVVDGKAVANANAINAINNAENGILAQAKSYTDGEVSGVQDDVNELSEYVGTFTHDTAKTVVEYIDAKTNGVATDTALNELQSAVDVVEGDVATIKGDYLKGSDKTELEGKITAAQNAANAAQGEVDALEQTHATDKAALEGAIALKADITALNEVSAVANAAVKQADYDVKVKSLEDEDARIVGLVEAEADRAAAAEKVNADAIKAIGDDYLKAADKTELQGNIDVVSGKVTTLIGEDADKSVRTIANEELAKQLIAENAAESLDTLAEIAAWIQSHPEDASAMNKAIDDLEALVGTLPQDITATNVVDYIAEVKAAIQVEIDRLDVEKQDVITEVFSNSGDKTISVNNTSGRISTDVITASDIVSINASGMMEVFVTDDILQEEFSVDKTHFELEDSDLVCNYTPDSSNNSVTLIRLSFRDDGIYLNTENVMGFDNFTITYKSTVEGMVVKKEHLPSDVVYEADLNSAIDSLNTANTGLSAEIAKKADKTTVEGIDGRVGTVEDEMDVVEGKVSTLEGKVSTLEGSVATKVEQSVYDAKVAELEGVDSDLDERLALVEAQLGDGENSVSDLIATAKQEAIDAAALDATTKAGQALTDAKAYTDTEVAKDRARLDSLEAIEHHEHSNKDVLDGITAEKVAGWDNAVAKVHEHSNKAVLDGITAENITSWNSVTSKASQTDLDNAVARIAVNEGAISTLNSTVADKAEQDDLDTAVLRIAANESAIAANTSKINSFVAITSDEVTALFA